MPIVAPVVRPYRNLAGRLVRSAFGTAPTALRFGSLTTDGVTCGNGLNKVFDNMVVFTVAFVVRPTTLATGAEIWAKANARSSIVGWEFVQSDALGNLRLKAAAATVNLEYITNTTPLAPVNVWRFVAATGNFNGGAGTRIHIYASKSLTAPLTEAGYGTKTEPSGAQSNDSANTLDIGNIGTAQINGFGGDIALALVIPGVEWTLTQLLQWQYNPLVVPQGCRGFWLLGQEPNRVLDLSGYGAHGTVN